MATLSTPISSAASCCRRIAAPSIADRTRLTARFGAALAAIALFHATAPGMAALIELKDSAGVATAVVRLGQISAIHDADEKVVERLADVTLCPAPTVGKSKTLDFETIRARLTSQGFDLADLEFSGSSMVTVSSARSEDSTLEGNSAVADLAQKRAEELVVGAVRQYLRDKAPALGNVQIELKLTPKQVTLLTAALSARIDISGGNEPWSGEQPFRAGFFDRQGQRKEFQVVCRVRPLPQVLVPTANLPKGHVVRPDDVSWKQQPVTANGAAYVDRTELIVGQETKRTLRAGEPISTIDVRGVPLVRRGDIVTVVARNHGIVVRTDAKALADGSLGQPIKLLSLDGRRELVGRVSGYHEASVGPLAGDETAAPGSGTGVRLVTVETPAHPEARPGAIRTTAGIPIQRPTLANRGER